MEIYKWKWMVLGALGYMNNADFGKLVNDNIVLDVFIICQKLLHVQVIKKIPYSYFYTFKVIPQTVHSRQPTMWKASNTVGFTVCEF